MPFLKYFGFDNYRVFNKETFVNLEQISILTGTNSSGKSSLIKAAKLLKQNTPSFTYSGLPETLNFIPDQYGHYLGEFKRISSHSNKNSSDISFSLPVNLKLLGDNYFVSIKYGTFVDSPNPEKAFLKEISINKFEGSNKKLIAKLTGIFDKFYVNFKEFKDSFEKVVIPYFKGLENVDSLFHDFDSYRSFQGNHLIKDLIKTDYKVYNPEEPILPFYEIIKGSARVSYDPDISPEISGAIEKNFEIVTGHFKEEVQRYADSKNVSFAVALPTYFKEIEKNLFDYINQHQIEFPIDFSTNYTDFTWWNGLLYFDSFDADLRTPVETQQKLDEFDEYYSNLMYLSDFCAYDKNRNRNSEILYDYIKYIVIECIEQCRITISNFHFFDSNRIEQLLFYHSSNSVIAYNLIVDSLNKEYRNPICIDEGLRLLNIADEHKIVAGESGIYTILLKKGDSWMPLSEFGFGISKIFFFLLAINTYPTLFIEEPESNLHPDLQSKLADLLANTLVSNTHLIIETHSEYFIRKLQYLVAVNKIDHQRIIINYFNSEGDKEKEGLLKPIRIRKDGGLDNEFGKGFYDEAATIIEDLFKLTYYN